MNKKGFTLIELIAVMTILALIMLIAVPNTLNLMEKNKRDSFINDAKTAIRLVSSKDRRENNASYPASYKINNHGIGTTNINTDSISDKSAFNEYYTQIRVLVCNNSGTKYYLIYMTDGKNEIRASKGVSSSNILKNYPDIDKDTSERYELVKKFENNQSFSC